MLPDKMMFARYQMPDVARKGTKPQQKQAVCIKFNCQILLNKSIINCQILPDRDKIEAPRIDFDALNKQQNDAVNDAVNDALRKHASAKLLSRYQELIKLLYTNGDLTLLQLIDSLSVSRATLQRDIKLLSSHNFISLIGSDKYREYTINCAKNQN